MLLSQTENRPLSETSASKLEKDSRTKSECNSTFAKPIFCLKEQFLIPGMLLSEAENPTTLIQGASVFELVSGAAV